MKKIISLLILLAANHTFAETVSIDLTNGNFIGKDAYNVVTSTQAQCTQLDNSGIGRTVWVEVNLNGYSYKECIRYYSAGLLENQTNNRAIAYFSGDVAIVGATAFPEYTNSKPQDKVNEAVVKSTELYNFPYIFVARPGIYGSSGVHNGARKPLESLLMSEALNKIKQRHQILNYVLVGHSGGGHIVSALLSKRTDILCAIPSSAPSSPKILAEALGKTPDPRLFETVDAITALTPKHPANRVFVVGDLNDSIVPWVSQKVLHDKLIQLSWASNIINLQAIDGSHHDVAEKATKIAGMCARGLPTLNILDQAGNL